MIDAFERRLPLTPRELAPIARTLEALPRVPSWTVVETRLVGEDAAVDLLVGVRRDGTTVDALLGPASGPTQGVRTFLDAWADEGDPVAGANVLWFEWDAPVGDRRPLVLYSLDPTFWTPTGREPDGMPVATRIAHLRRAAGAPSSVTTEAALGRFVAALPRSARLLCATWLGPRGLDVDRLFVGMPAWEVRAWLGRVGWPGDLGRGTEWLHRMVAPWEVAWLQVEIAADLGPYLAIETPQSDTAPGGRREDTFLPWLVESAGARPGLVDALVAWRGIESRGGISERRSFHVKVVLRPDQDPVVKGYFGVHHTA